MTGNLKFPSLAPNSLTLTGKVAICDRDELQLKRQGNARRVHHRLDDATNLLFPPREADWQRVRLISSRRLIQSDVDGLSDLL